MTVTKRRAEDDRVILRRLNAGHIYSIVSSGITNRETSSCVYSLLVSPASFCPNAQSAQL